MKMRLKRIEKPPTERQKHSKSIAKTTYQHVVCHSNVFAFQLLIKNIFTSEVIFVLHVNFVIKILLMELKHNLI